MSCPPKDPDEREKDWVITPGGPRPRDKVRAVKPGEAVHRDEEGCYEVVPDEKPDDGASKKGDDDA